MFDSIESFCVKLQRCLINSFLPQLQRCFINSFHFQYASWECFPLFQQARCRGGDNRTTRQELHFQYAVDQSQLRWSSSCTKVSILLVFLLSIDHVLHHSLFLFSGIQRCRRRHQDDRIGSLLSMTTRYKAIPASSSSS